MNVSKLLVLVMLFSFGGEALAQHKFALSFTVKETVGGKLLPAQGFLILKPSLTQKQPRLYLAQGGVYCTVRVGDNGKVAIDSVTFTSTRQNKFFRLPLSGEKSLSKFWVSESLTIEVTINSDGTVSVTTKPNRVTRRLVRILCPGSAGVILYPNLGWC